MVVLEQDGDVAVLEIIAALGVGRRANQFLVVLDQNVVVENGHPRGMDDFAVFEHRRAVNDIEALPFARRAGGVCQGRVLALDGAQLAVEVGVVLMGIQNLYLVGTEEDATVAALLSFQRGLRDKLEFHV